MQQGRLQIMDMHGVFDDIVSEIIGLPIGESWFDSASRHKNGKRSGSGTFKYMNGDIYTGNWKEGKRFGDGSFVYSNGEKQTGIWEDGRLLLK